MFAPLTPEMAPDMAPFSLLTSHVAQIVQDSGSWWRMVKRLHTLRAVVSPMRLAQALQLAWHPIHMLTSAKTHACQLAVLRAKRVMCIIAVLCVSFTKVWLLRRERPVWN